MKIVFTWVKDEDVKYFSENLKGHQLIFYKDYIDKINVEEISDTDILSVFVFDKLDKEKLSRFKNLKLIVTRSVGFDHIDIDYCKENNIKVANIPSYSPKSIAEHTLALLLSLTRKLKTSIEKTTKVDFTQTEDLMGLDLDDLTVGIIGTGRIGSWVARMCLSLGMKVYAYDVIENEELKKLGVKYVDFDTLIESSDVISLHVPYSPQTHHLINGEAIKKMKEGVILINTSRGAVVDTDALYEALKEGKIGGAGLDVFEDEDILILEKYEDGHSTDKNLKIIKLSTLPNVIITPHIAYYTTKAVKNIRKHTVEAIKMFLETGKLGSFEVV